MNWSSKLIHHRNEIRIAVYFEKNTKLIERIKQFEGADGARPKKYGIYRIMKVTEYILRYRQLIYHYHHKKEFPQ